MQLTKSRLALIAGGALVLAAIAVTAIWFVNRGVAKARIEAALAQLEAAGVEARYDDLSIAGFPTAYEGVLTNFRFRSTADNVAFTMPRLSAGMSLTSIGTVDFVFPEAFEAERLDATGAPTGEKLLVQSERLVAAVTPQEAGDLDIVVRADRLRMAPQGVEAEHVEWRGFETRAKLDVDRGAEAAAIRGVVRAAALEARLSAERFGGPEAASLIAEGVEGELEGDVEHAVARFDVQSVIADDGQGSLMRIAGLGFTARLEPEDRFDAAALFNLPTGADLTGGLADMMAAALVERGAVDADFRIRKLDTQLAVADGSSATISLGVFALDLDLSPRSIAVALTAGQTKFDALIDGAANAAAISDLQIAASGAPGLAYDFSGLRNAADYRDAVAIIADILRREIAQGGQASLRIASTGYETDTRGDAPELGVERYATVFGPNETKISLSADALDVMMRSDRARYAFEGVVEGGVEMQSFELLGRHPLKKGEGGSAARLFLNVADVDVDPTLWTALRLGGQPERLPGLRFDAEIETALAGDLLNMPSFLALTAVRYERVSLREALIDLLGFKAEAAGVVDLLPAPQGSVLLSLENWPAFHQRLSQSAIGEQLQPALGLAMAQSFIEQYGQVGDRPNEIVLNLDIAAEGLSVNGAPLQ